MRPAAVFDRIQRPPPAAPRILLDRAVVLGGSVAGLLAARVLAGHAREVVVVEPDGPAGPDGTRPGAPHGNQLHVLLPGGRGQFDRWFPGFSDQAVAAGAVRVAPTARRRYRNGRPSVTGARIDLLNLTRALLEDLLRGRVAELPGVTVVRRRATGLEVTGDAVTGVRCAGPGTPGDETVESAGLVVDAMGRSSRLGDWLARAGWEAPPLRRMPIRINYATAMFRRTEPDPPLKTVLALRGTEGEANGTGAALAAVEGDRWMVMVAGFVDDRPGRDTGEFLRRCRTDYPPEFAAAVSGEMLGPVVPYTLAESRRREFHALGRMPAGLVAVGDAVASFNPIYGQGLSSAALHAACLAAYLGGEPDLRAPAREFLELQRVVVDAAWNLSTNADLALPHIDGPYPRGYRLTRWLSHRLVEAAQVDPVLAQRFDQVSFMLRHPATLTGPGTLARALWASRGLENGAGRGL